MQESAHSLPDRWQDSHYDRLGLHPSASVIEIRRAYRERSKLYHPDTTTLPTAIATRKFQQLNDAYAVLSNPQRRLWYDNQIGYSRWHVVQASPAMADEDYDPDRLAYISASDRPLSSGELFALFILGVTFVGCLGLAIAVGLTQGETAIQIPLP
ncbi:MAG: J domain-containing protein [Spirulina sp. SIO3F2]|nr:J domain-containing protein [Spirulina sp. SIO3F2]